MKTYKKLSMLVMLVLAMYCLSPGQAFAASGVKASSYKKVTSISNGAIRQEASSSKYIVFSKQSYGTNGYTIYYSSDMKKFYSFDFEKATGYKFGTDSYSKLDSVFCLNDKFYFFVGGFSKEITYYETTNFKKFTKRVINHKVVDVDMPSDYCLYKSGAYYYLTSTQYDIGDVSLNRIVLRSKDMKNWSRVTAFDKFAKQIGSNNAAITDTAFGDAFKIGKSGNTILVTVTYAVGNKTAYYKTNDFVKYTKVTEDKGADNKPSTETEFVKLPGENKVVRLVFNKANATVTVYTGKDLTGSYKKIKTISKVRDYRFSIYNNGSKKHYVTLLVRTKAGKNERYTSNAAVTSFSRYTSKLNASKIGPEYSDSRCAWELGNTYRAFPTGSKMLVSKAANHFKTYKTIATPMSKISEAGVFKNKMYLIGYSDKNNKDSYGLYTLDTSKLN